MPGSSLDHLLSELRRRRVWRVLAAYIVAAWVAIEVADTIFVNLGLPGWSVRLVIVLAAIGLPVAIALAWAFDVTPEGVRRAVPAGPVGDNASRLGSGARTRGLLYGGGIVAMLGLASMLWLAPSDGPQLDPNRIALLPLRTAGAAADVAHLREGLPDLLAASLAATDAGTQTVVSTRAVGSALGRHGLRDAEIAEEDGLAVAAELGAGVLLLGEMVGDGRRIIVTMPLLDVHTGRVRARLRIEGSPDSLHLLTDGLANQLVAALGGTPQHRLAAVTTTSRDALDAYIRGAAAFRRAAYEEAVRHLDRAIEIDSTFALAALWLADAGSWTSERPPNYLRANRLAWNSRQQLGEEDRSYLEARLGRNYPEPAPFAELIRIRERGARNAPGRAEMLYLAGDAYLHFGALVGYPNALDRAAEYFGRAAEIDSMYAGVLEHSAVLALRRDDPATFDRYFNRVVALDSTSSTAEVLRWLRARAAGSDERPADVVLETIGPALAYDLVWTAAFAELGIAEAGQAIYEAADRATGPDGVTLSWAALSMATMEGLPRQVDEAVRHFRTEPWHDTFALRLAAWWYQDASAADDLVDRVARNARAESGEVSIGAAIEAGQWYARTGRLDQAREMLDRLVPDAASSPNQLRDIEIGARLLSASIAHAAGDAGARSLLERTDAMARSGYRASRPLRDFVNVELGRIWEERGEHQRALDAYRRCEEYSVDLLRVERLAEEGRLAELIGDHAGAIDAYRRYLQFRTRPEGVFAERTAVVRGRLAVLSGERPEL